MISLIQYFQTKHELENLTKTEIQTEKSTDMKLHQKWLQHYATYRKHRHTNYIMHLPK